tara:strand:+ start:1588 stop:2145 length:558 start_codon:yes stop_codon:yes gene_type:complete
MAKGFKDSNGKFRPTGNSSNGVSKEQIAHQKKFGISSKGTLGLNKHKPKEVLQFDEAVNELQDLVNLYKKAIITDKFKTYERVYSHSMLEGTGGVKENDYRDAESHMGIIASLIRIYGGELDHVGVKQKPWETWHLADDIEKISAEMGNDWWDDQSGNDAKKNLEHDVKRLEEILTKLKSLTDGF